MLPVITYRLIEEFIKKGKEWDLTYGVKKEDAIDFAHKNINPEPERYIKHNHYSLEYCLAHYGENINNRFRQDRADKNDYAIADLIDTRATKVPLVLYRGVCKPVFDTMKENAKGMKGVDLYEKSFLQTSLVKGCESLSDIQLRIFVPEGTKAIYLGNVNDEQYFYEVALQHGARLEVISADHKYINCKLLGTD